jgi:single-stranded-DNA-specific exonuclease
MHWQTAAPPDAAMAESFPEYPPVVVQLLWNRGIRTQEAADEFLLPDYGQDLHDPFLFREMETACARVWSALERGEKIVVYSDYDADGVTGAVVLVSTIRAMAGRLGRDEGLVSSYIPHREKEGYGLRTEAVEALVRDGIQLIITVDCGIGSAKEIAVANSMGADAIVVDHHQVPIELPKAIILHPLVSGETYPFKFLAAVGVAFKFASGLIAYAARRGAGLEPGFDKWLLDLVAIATVTDFMPLVGENRTLEKYGLIVLNKTRRPGLRKIAEVAGLSLGSMDTHSIGYQIGPRINAASRMNHASLAFETLMAETDEQAADLAGQLQRFNSERQRLTDTITIAARALIQGRTDRRIHILAGDGWPSGVVGLIAGKLVGETGVPVFIFGRDGERLTGSGRGISGFDVMVGLEKAKAHLVRYGGHPQACGLTIMGEENFQGFCRIMEDHAEKELAGRDLRPVLGIDAEVRTSQISWELVDWLQKMEPFGEGNHCPKFVLKDLLVTSIDGVGKDGKHVRIGIRGDAPKEMKMIGFNLAAAAASLGAGSRIDAVVEIGINEWNGNRSIQLKIIDWRQAGAVLPV